MKEEIPTPLVLPVAQPHNSLCRQALKEYFKGKYSYMPSEKDQFWMEQKRRKRPELDGEKCDKEQNTPEETNEVEPLFEFQPPSLLNKPVGLANVWRYKVRELILECSEEAISSLNTLSHKPSARPTLLPTQPGEGQLVLSGQEARTLTTLASVTMAALAKHYKERRRSAIAHELKEARKAEPIFEIPENISHPPKTAQIANSSDVLATNTTSTIPTEGKVFGQTLVTVTAATGSTISDG